MAPVILMTSSSAALGSTYSNTQSTASSGPAMKPSRDIVAFTSTFSTIPCTPRNCSGSQAMAGPAGGRTLFLSRSLFLILACDVCVSSGFGHRRVRACELRPGLGSVGSLGRGLQDREGDDDGRHHETGRDPECQVVSQHVHPSWGPTPDWATTR